MKNLFIVLAIAVFAGCVPKDSSNKKPEEFSTNTMAMTSQDTIDLLNIYRLNIEEGKIDAIQTTWSEDARWLNAFGRVFIGRDTVISWLRFLWSEPGYAASRITRQDEPKITFIRPDVAVIHEYHEREGQVINAVVTPTRKINTTYILSKEKGTWLIRDKVTMDERERSE